MVFDEIYGDNVFAYVDGILVGCGTSISIKSSRKEIATTCVDSGDVEQAKVGKAKHTFSMDLAWRRTTLTDIAEEQTAMQFWTKYLAKTQITVIFKRIATPVAGDISYTGVGFIKDIDLSGQLDEQGKVSVQGFFNSLDIVQVPAV